MAHGNTYGIKFYTMNSLMEKMPKFFEFIIEAFGWLQIFASPFLIGSGIGAAVYFSNPTFARLVTGICIAVAGLVAGAVWATKICKKKGTNWFLSRINATPELDEKPEDENNNIS